MKTLPGAPALGAKRVVGLVSFAAAMGWLEAVVVVYIRGLLGFPHDATIPSPDQLYTVLRTVPWLIGTEQTREIATLVMLVSAAWLAGRTPRSRMGAFLVCFGVWDIVYYVGLYALLRWPPSLTTMDLLFLVPPGPWWYQPVWVPVLISCGMVASGLWLARGPAAR